MSYKIATSVSLILLIGLGSIYLYTAMQLPEHSGQAGVGPSYFPLILGTFLIVLSILDLIKTIRKSDTKIPIPNMRYILSTLAVLAIFFILWGMTTNFYLFGSLFMVILLVMYQIKTFTIRKLINSVVITAGVMITIYLLFEQLMGFRL